MKRQSGITLVVLVITIIIMLVLAGTTITISVNGGDIFGKASQTREEWNNAISRTEEKVQETWNVLNDIRPPVSTLPRGWNKAVVELAYQDSNSTRKAPIPKGFVASQATGENTIDGGLVIYEGLEEVTDLNVEEARTTRNQYVWIPVDNSSTITWTKENADKSLLSRGDSKKEAALTLTEDFDAMKASVQVYGGFYISRYELSENLSMKNKYPTSGVDWYYCYNIAHQDKTFESNIVLKGHMIFGSEFLKVMDFIDENNEGYSTTGHPSKQEHFKHNSGIYLQQGKELDIVKNIIDFEGNIFEWTTEAAGGNARVTRSSCFERAQNENFSPISSYFYQSVTGGANTGARQALYVPLP